ncbi:hypothetical protein Aglo03_04520 [Actinokineospora globicatena]|uniref:HTH cro/C1-type domain-containing protein n=2 Tax=Actinokineospora globicatena TaxID=103729 RepID=A0A9W6QGF9_9PSEU|nr:hypothetical protein Aglo03_04520 [Actinokineospora globicatena]
MAPNKRTQNNVGETGLQGANTMPRHERPLDAGDDAVVRFAADLRLLRLAAGSPTYRELAARVHFSVTTLSSAANGRRLPSLAVTLAYVRGCAGDTAEWERRWHRVALEQAMTAGPVDPPLDGPTPYVGLAAYQPEDAERFHGRERVVEQLLDRVGRQRFVALFGASGAGKSSLLRAGLVPRWQAAEPDRHVVLFTPGPHPLDEAAARLASPTGLARHDLVRVASTHLPGNAELLLVVDQFEEVFTLCLDDTERARFVELLLTAARTPDGRCRVVLGVRADFYAHCTRYPDLVDALEDAQVAVGPMTNDELRQAIVRPAVDAGFVLEGALVAELLAQSAGNAGALPLLSHALLETWYRRRGNTLTLAGFHAAGGIDGALARSAESAFACLSPGARQSARALFLRLTALGDGTADTKRRVVRSELTDDTAEVLAALAERRLITVSAEAVEIAHEALIHAWPRLRDWLAADREGQRTHRATTRAAQEWEVLDRDPGALYRGVRLSAALEWARRADGQLNPVERAFLAASSDQQAGERAAAARRTRQSRYVMAALAVLVTITTVIGVVAAVQRADAVRARQAAVSRQLATRALALAHSDPITAKLLSVEANRAASTIEARSALISLSAYRHLRTDVERHAQAVSGVAFTPDGTLVSASQDQTLSLWRGDDRGRTATLRGHHTWIRALAVNSAGTLAATGGDDRRVVLWDLRARTVLREFTGSGDIVRVLEFSPDGGLLAGAGNDLQVRLWDVPSGRLVATLTGHTASVAGLAFSPDGATLASSADDRTIRLWDVTRHTPVATLTGHTNGVRAVEFSPDGHTLASTGDDTTVALWDVPTRTRTAVLADHTLAVYTLAFSADGRTLVSAGSDAVIRLWDTTLRTPRGRLAGHRLNLYSVAFSPTEPNLLAVGGENGRISLWDTAVAPIANGSTVNDVAFTPDGRRLATAGVGGTTLWDMASHTPARRLAEPDGVVNSVVPGTDGTVVSGVESAHDPYDPAANGVVVWHPREPLAGHGAAVVDVATSPDGRTAASASIDHTAILWDVPTRTRLATFDVGAVVTGVAFSPNGQTLATADHDNHLVTLWDVGSHSRRTTFTGHTGWVRSLAFSPDGALLASASTDQTVIVWDVATGTRVATLPGHADAPFTGVAFSPDGSTLAYTGNDNTIRLWNVRERAIAARLSGRTSTVRSLAFSPDGTTLAAAADDTTILWDLDPDRTAREICANLSHGLTAAQWAEHLPETTPHETCPR